MSHKELSIYHEYPVEEELSLPKSKNPVNKTIAKDTLEPYKKTILYSLYKYGILNKQNIAYAIQLKKRNRWKESMLGRTLVDLRKDGYIKAYGCKTDKKELDYSLVLYVLSNEGLAVIKDTYKITNIGENRIWEEIILKENSINPFLKRASLNQFHLSILFNYRDKLEKSSYYGKKTRTGKPIPSMISFKPKEKTSQLSPGIKKITLYAFPAPRKEEEMEEFLLLLIEMESQLLEGIMGELALLVIICEHIQHAAWFSWQSSRYRQVRPFYFLYSQDMVTAQKFPLSYFYSCEAKEDGILHANINLL